VLVHFLSTTGPPPPGVVTAFVLAVVGSLLFAAQGRTEPPPHGQRRPQRPLGDPHTRYPGCCSSSARAVGAVLGSLEIALVAYADERDAMALSGVLIAPSRSAPWPAESAGAACTGGTRCGTGWPSPSAC
jgi:hypothetical protein